MAYGVANIVGMILYSKVFQHFEFKSFLAGSTIVCALISSLQLLLVTGVNSYIGIPNSFFAILCTFVVQVTGELNMMPLLVLCCRICPKNIEGSLYALLMSVMNLGAMLSFQGGGILMIILGITQTNFSHLWALVLITSLLMLTPLPILAIIPNLKIGEEKKGYELV